MVLKIKRKLKKFLLQLGQILMHFGKLASPFGDQVQGSKEEYLNLANNANDQIYEEVELHELNTGFSIEKDWINNLALHTQIVKKESTLNFAHGRVLYSTLRAYLADKRSRVMDNSINIIETGTARGFSALCMAKALDDSNIYGSILTFDLISNDTKIYWNCIDDIEKKKTRLELLEQWNSLVSKYLIFIEGDTRMTLRNVSLKRVNFAFLDGAHTYEDVKYEFSMIKDKQLKGDIIVYDDYNPKLFPGIVKAVDEICSLEGYTRTDIKTSSGRDYVVTVKAK